MQVNASYPGADAETISDTVAGPIESMINGVEDMIYMSSNSANDGSYSLKVSFEVGSDPDMNTVNVQNRVAQAMASLPEEVKRLGVTTTKQSSDMLMVVNLFSPENTYDSLFLNNYANINVTDVLARVKGVGKAALLGVQDYAMRVWLNPDSLASFGLTTGLLPRQEDILFCKVQEYLGDLEKAKRVFERRRKRMLENCVNVADWQWHMISKRIAVGPGRLTTGEST